ncbi:MAG: response regulator transcription factor, partial [Pseudomonadota bacterium]
ARELLALGMSGYVVKEAAFDELLTAIRAVAAGDQYLCRALIEPGPVTTETGMALTDREVTCLRHAAQGLTAKAIARELGITERTVRFHFSNLCRKFGVQRRSEAVADALRQQLISL